MAFRHYAACALGLFLMGCELPGYAPRTGTKAPVVRYAEQSLSCPLDFSDGIDEAERKRLAEANAAEEGINEIKGFRLDMSNHDVVKHAKSSGYAVEDNFSVLDGKKYPARFLDPYILGKKSHGQFDRDFDYRAEGENVAIRFKYANPFDMEHFSDPLWESGEQPWLLTEIVIEFDPSVEWKDDIRKSLRERYGLESSVIYTSLYSREVWGNEQRGYVSYVEADGKHTVTLKSGINDLCNAEIERMRKMRHEERMRKEKEKGALEF